MRLTRTLAALSLLTAALTVPASARVDTLRQGYKGYTGCTDTYLHWYTQNGYGSNDNSTQSELKAQSG